MPEVVLGKECDKGSNKANFCYLGINPLPIIVKKSMPLIALNYGWGF